MLINTTELFHVVSLRHSGWNKKENEDLPLKYLWDIASKAFSSGATKYAMRIESNARDKHENRMSYYCKHIL